MTVKESKYIIDIALAIDLIFDFLDKTETFDEYLTDYKTQSAVERQLGIIGEAMSKLRDLKFEYEFEYQNQIIGLRNRLIHAYDGVNQTIIWFTLEKHLPRLKQEILNLQK